MCIILQAYEVEIQGEILEARRRRLIAQVLMVIGCFAFAGYLMAAVAGLAYFLYYYDIMI